MFLRELLAPFCARLAGARIVVGRLVRFVATQPDDALGESRLRAAFASAGFSDVEAGLECAAAGHRFAEGLDAPAIVLVGDFGGGTSDFSVLRLIRPAAPGRGPGPCRRRHRRRRLDYRIIDRLVLPLLGKGGSYTVMGARRCRSRSAGSTSLRAGTAVADAGPRSPARHRGGGAHRGGAGAAAAPDPA